MTSYRVTTWCAGCGGRFRWVGRLTNPPACPRCGHRGNPVTGAEAQAQMDRLVTDPAFWEQVARALEDAR